MARVLVVEDEEDILEVVSRYLKLDSHEVLTAKSLEEMYEVLEKGCVDLIVLDLLLPDGDAMDEIPSIKIMCPETFIIVLTALREDRNRILGLELGADDYVTKPFNPRELVARVRAVMRRKGSLEKVLTYKDMKLIVHERTLQIGEETISLSGKEFDILLLMFQNPKRVFSRYEILEYVWRGSERSDRIVDVYMSTLRKKIGKERLVTVRGVGYKLG
ncbi:MAG: response regulator transcription factor [Pseudothermotoga sp.]|uniref:Response regulator transcription factor n=1 Tax=Pseudothermotoga hypogea TaxID=57487 RepID=A0A832MNS8_9THEM|nr:response regulator transcription factor [Pseudothermotoga sp.]MBC7123105.1 response regulator transcription factor [Pseudothermotoga sp.]MDI6863321.1 response regulator transcription factor [Pseudothermotoga sp.]